MSTQATTFALTRRVGDATLRLVLLCIAHHVSNESGQCFAGQKTLAKEAEVGERSMRRYLDQLEEMGAITRQKRTREDGSRSTDLIILSGFVEWLDVIENGGTIPKPPAAKPVADAPDLAGGAANLAGGTGQQVAGQEQSLNKKINTSRAGRAQEGNSQFEEKKKQQEGPVRSVHTVSRGDPSWTRWLDNLKAHGHREVTEAIERRGSLTAYSRWPPGDRADPLPSLIAPTADHTSRMLGETDR